MKNQAIEKIKTMRAQSEMFDRIVDGVIRVQVGHYNNQIQDWVKEGQTPDQIKERFENDKAILAQEIGYAYKEALQIEYNRARRAMHGQGGEKAFEMPTDEMYDVMWDFINYALTFVVLPEAPAADNLQAVKAKFNEVAKMLNNYSTPTLIMHAKKLAQGEGNTIVFLKVLDVLESRMSSDEFIQLCDNL